MKRRILLVDDSGLARRLLRTIFEEAGYEVSEATDGLSALERYAVERPDAVLLDLVMRGMYGLDVLEKMRQMDPDARVIVVSADIQESSQQLVQEAGASAFLVKPVDRERVLNVVRDLIGSA